MNLHRSYSRSLPLLWVGWYNRGVDYFRAMQAGFLDELEKIAASKAMLQAVSKTRRGKVPMRVSTLLKKEKDGTLWKTGGEGSVGNLVSTAAGDPPGMTGGSAKAPKSADEPASRDDAREHIATIPAPGVMVLAPAVSNTPAERTNV